METIPKADCEKVGFFRKTHGVQGEMVLEFEQKYEYSVEEANCFFVELEGLLVPFFLMEEGFRFKTTNTAILTFDGIESEKYAKRLVGSSVYLYQHDIIQMDEESVESYFLNYLLIDTKMGEIGVINQIDDYSGNIVFTVNYRGQELLVPFNEEILIELDDKQKTVKLALPDGLLENEEL